METSIGTLVSATKEPYTYQAEDWNGNHGYTRTYTSYAERLVEKDVNSIFDNIFVARKLTRGGKTLAYETVAPTAALDALRLVAEACLEYSHKHPLNFTLSVKGLICAGVVLFAGIMALIEYLAAYIEFLLVSSVGVILFPLSLWEGSKFMAEKFIGAMLGFFLKLLFATIGIFFMLYGYLSLAANFTVNSFAGATEQIIEICFVSALYLLIVKSAPHLAQSLLSGVPSLNAAGAIGAVTSAVGAAAAVGGAASNAAGAGTRAALSGTATLAKAGGAAAQALSSPGGGGALKAAGAFMGSLGHSAGMSAYNNANALTRSLVSRPLFGSQPRHPGDPGLNPSSAPQRLLGYNDDGSRRTLAQAYGESIREGQKLAGKQADRPAPHAAPQAGKRTHKHRRASMGSY